MFTTYYATLLAIVVFEVDKKTTYKKATYDDSMFSILAKGGSPFYLSALEATFIRTSNPILCRQKEFIYNLKILRVSAEL